MISKEEAIHILEIELKAERFVRKCFDEDQNSKVAEALEMSITALKFNPQAAREAIDEIINTAQSQPERPKGRWIPVHEHMWRKFEGSIDEFAWESGYHNGPVCELCGEHICIHCNPDWEKDECAVESYKCSECNHRVKEKTEYCPHCGSDNRGEEE